MSSPGADGNGHDDLADDAVQEMDMAQAMGFSSFGMKSRPSKKRRLNADNAVVGEPSAAAPAAPAGGNSVARGTGANSIPIAAGLPPKPPAPAGSPGAIPLAMGAPKQVAILGAAPGDALSSPSVSGDKEQLSSSGFEGEDKDPGLQEFTSAQRQTLPPGYSMGAKSDMAPSHQHGKHGSFNNANRHQRQWWLDYYDHDSNANPWEDLEKRLGLPPLGTYLPRRRGRGG